MKAINKIFLHSTYLCNANCIHCAVQRDKKIISYTDYKKLIDISAASNVDCIIIGWGEPLLHPNIIDMVKYASDKGIKVKIETNGLLMTEDLLDSLRPYLFGNKFWSSGYFYQTVGCITAETVKDYVAKGQNKHWMNTK